MKRKIALSIALLLSAGQGICADVDPVTKQIEALNKQLQAQLQAIQQEQQKQATNFNTQIQGQLKTLQATMQKQIDDNFDKTQEQIKDVKTNLEAEINMVNQAAAKGK